MSRLDSIKSEIKVSRTMGCGLLDTRYKMEVYRSVVFIETNSEFDEGTGSIVDVFNFPQPMLLTCHHVIPSKEIAEKCTIYFDRENSAKPGTPVRGGDLFDFSRPFLTSSEQELDCILIPLKTSAIPGYKERYRLVLDQYRNLESNALKQDDVVSLVHYPLMDGEFARRESSSYLVQCLTGFLFGYEAGILGGFSAGCPVLKEVDKQWVLVGLHIGRMREPTEKSREINVATNIEAIHKIFTVHGYTLPAIRMQDLFPEGGRIPPVKEMTFSANKDSLLTADSGMDDSNISTSSSDVEDIQSQVKAALKNGSVKVEVVKSVFLGPPGVGKTQLKCALLGDFREVKESTNVSTPAAPAVEVILADTTQKKWELLNISHLNELSMDKNSWSDKQWSSSADTYGQPPGTRRSTSVDSQVTSSSQSPMRSTKPSGAVEKDTFESRSKRFEKIDRDILTFITEAKAKRGSKEKLEFKLVYIIDNGGQPSFLDFHSVTATFAASYVHLFDASKGLSDFPEMTFRNTKFSIRHMPPSIYSNVDLLRRSLLTVHQFKHRFDQRHEKLQALLGKTAFQPADSPHVLIVGTHKDSSKISVQEATKDLDSICESIPSLKDQYNIVFVDSLNRKCEGLRSICDTLSHEDNLSQFDLPLSWFQVCLLSLLVANGSDKNLHAQKYDDLYEMCRHQNHVESPEEFRAMITVMHCLGVFCIPELEQLDAEDDVSNVLIFFNPNLLFEYLTQIFAIPFLDLQSSESRISSNLLRKLQVRGVLTPECLSKLDIPDTLGTLPGFRNKLLGWLVDWCLAAKIDGEDQWFIPSVLPPRPKKTPPFVPSGYFENVFPLYLTFFQPEETTSNNCFHYLPAGFFPHLVVHLMQTGRFCLPENSKNNESGYPYRCRDSIVLSERGSMKCTLNICLVDESDRLAVYMWPAYQLLNYDPSALCHAGAVLSDLKSCMTQTNERLFCTSIGKIALCPACRCKPSSPQSSSQAVQPALIHLAKVYCLVGGKAWLQCLSHSGFGAPPIFDIDDSLAKVLHGFSGQAQDLKSTGSVESETVDTLPDTPIVKLETTPIAGRENTQQLLDKYKDNFKSDPNSQSALQRSKVDDIIIIPSPVCFEVEALRTLPLEKDLREISDNCGNSWKSLLSYVGLKSTKIQECRTDEGTLPDACFHGLVYWLGGNVDDSDPVNWSTLLTAMKKAGMAGNGREWKQKIVERCAASLDKPRDAGQSGNDETSTPRLEEAN